MGTVRAQMEYVLFVCNHNAGRSQMAQAFFERLAPDGVRAESAGTDPGERIWPEVVDVMREAGIDVAGRAPKELTEEMQRRADLAVTMGCGDACPYVPTTVLDWTIPDPAGRPLDEVRAIRDIVAEHVRTLIGERFGVAGDEVSQRESR
jgi:arsenate reductase